MANETVKTAAEQLVEAVEIIKAAKADILKLDGEVASRQAQIDATTKSAAVAVEVGPKVVDLLVKAGRLREEHRKSALENITNPGKVATELCNVLEMMTQQHSAGRVDGEPATATGEKTASARASDAMAEMDARHRERLGLK